MHTATVSLLMYVLCLIYIFLYNREIPLELIGSTALFILFGICLELAKLNKKKG